MDGYWFTSSLFDVEPGEDEETSPGCYGRQLAVWLKNQLELRGYNVEPVIAEDFGRCLTLSRNPFPLWVGCGNIDDPKSDPPSSENIIWHCFPVAEIPFFKRIFGKPDTTSALSRLHADLGAILNAEPAIILVAEK
ncbi:MAG: hypothetical protein LBU11_09570 [Zoogloeaceae bacterium]|jgi:hypothetical protein|nr:hypothetical protein [Zoogloeaceae bacterium]